jgi:hypothetical protein
MQQEGNQPIPVFEEWIRRRIEFHGEPDSVDVIVSYTLPAATRLDLARSTDTG